MLGFFPREKKRGPNNLRGSIFSCSLLSRSGKEWRNVKIPLIKMCACVKIHYHLIRLLLTGKRTRLANVKSTLRLVEGRGEKQKKTCEKASFLFQINNCNIWLFFSAFARSRRSKSFFLFLSLSPFFLSLSVFLVCDKEM